MSFAVTASVGGALAGGYLSSRASKKASQAQQASADAAQQLEWDMFQQQRDDQEPFRQAGVAANKRLSELMGLSSGYRDLTLADFNQIAKTPKWASALAAKGDSQGDWSKYVFDRYKNGDWGDAKETAEHFGYSPANFEEAPSADSGSLLRKFSGSDLAADPVYQSGLQFGLDEGTKAINARATGMGNYDSGATLKALTKFGNDYGSTKANESYNRFENTNTNIYNRLAGLSGAGQIATNQVGAASQNYANNASNLITDSGNARAAGIVGQANAWNTALGGVTDAWNTYNQNKTLDRILSSRGY